jgi:hypothetical protein
VLEHELRELQIEWPETPDISGAVAPRLTAPPPRRPWLLARPAWQLAVALLALLIAVAMAIPPARAEVLDWLGFGSVRIERREPVISQFGSGLGLGDATTLEQASRQAGFRVLVPAELGRPDAVYVRADPTTGSRVDLVYRPRPGLPRASTTGAGLLITELRGAVFPAIQKTVGAAAKLERLAVSSDPALFISGADHGFAYVPEGADMNFEPQRLAGPTLLVDRADGTLIRVEGRISRERAVEIAESVR